MIRGVVNDRKEAIVSLHIKGGNGQAITRQVVIDTGFSGFLTLSLALVLAMQLPFVETRTFTMGDDSQVNFNLYAATVVWDGNDRDIFVLATDGGTLLGMSMLYGYRLFVDVVDGGDVTIEEHP